MTLVSDVNMGLVKLLLLNFKGMPHLRKVQVLMWVLATLYTKKYYTYTTQKIILLTLKVILF